MSGKRTTDARQRLLVSAAKIMARRGFAATSVEEIVRSARLAKPALYYYFRDKDGLYEAILQEAFEQRFTIVQKHLASKTPWPRRLKQLTRAILDFTRKNQSIAILSFRIMLAPDEKFPWRPRVQKLAERNFGYMCEFLEQGVQAGHLRRDFPPRQLASLLHGQMIFHFFGRTLHSCNASVNQEAETIVSLFMQGAGQGANT